MEQILATAATAPIDVDMNNFMAEVVEGSSQLPVIVQPQSCCQASTSLQPIIQ